MNVPHAKRKGNKMTTLQDEVQLIFDDNEAQSEEALEQLQEVADADALLLEANYLRSLLNNPIFDDGTEVGQRVQAKLQNWALNEINEMLGRNVKKSKLTLNDHEVAVLKVLVKTMEKNPKVIEAAKQEVRVVAPEPKPIPVISPKPIPVVTPPKVVAPPEMKPLVKAPEELRFKPRTPENNRKAVGRPKGSAKPKPLTPPESGATMTSTVEVTLPTGEKRAIESTGQAAPVGVKPLPMPSPAAAEAMIQSQMGLNTQVSFSQEGSGLTVPGLLNHILK